ncbi:AAA family ATPase [bacterium (Candidatus Blackallbacteria) CG17_big_fil_post_rev_8_21_14_2_50_48_46]|uniref:AAA family ATPase n=1 Tax=bacterium (Candidatus Blackallbacteria) CG17_big_fil_post_rev_8_21_14_2_50_48_46 TaxID=2014261 RepID=A0A2M7G1E3_9BACT|nr:MAG: AAA family ATPase [bacterium (Candidatus Blackallbacteria) CG18_big_fil_WC_8_21_14_2_50_49_26]PIW15108.1 MAG: AAA family ATPase [bacterium (Candidatus Blackallbacteria) CG17_big_fil_post_rev_8_21_14_2_50_48_46]PIW47658.1 MAG: AAA family ATPase [bacterium (Candidatus Blackallbacteria) CG13_big_fil_rev_8_21_14_2_50_49_14]
MQSIDLPYYRPIGQEIQIFEHAWRRRLPLLLKGPTGSGKSRFVEYMAARLNQKLITVSCHEETSAVDLLGRYLIQGAETVWQDGPLTRAVREGAILYLDEIAEARPDTLVVLHSLTDHRRELFLERHNENLKAPESFILIASFNPGYQRGIKELKPSTRQRFLALSFDYPKADIETEILIAETGLDTARAQKLVQLAGKIRKLVEWGLAETVSTRLLIDAGALIADGLPPRLSCEVGIAEPLTDEADTRLALRDLIALYF